MIDTRVSHNDDSGLLETLGDIVGKVTGGESPGNRLSADEGREFENGSVTVGSGGDDTDIVGVFDSRKDTSGEDELLPSLADVQNVNTCC